MSFKRNADSLAVDLYLICKYEKLDGITYEREKENTFNQAPGKRNDQTYFVLLIRSWIKVQWVCSSSSSDVSDVSYAYFV